MKHFSITKALGTALLCGALTTFLGTDTAGAQPQAPDRSQETCDTYDMDVSEDLRLLGERATAVLMAADAGGDLPAITLGQTYEITLHPQSDVKFTVEPSQVMLSEGSYAGFMGITAPTSGRYRFSFSGASWVDVVADGASLDTVLFAGRHACQPLRKLVDYDLEAGKSYMLMLSGRSTNSMLMTARALQE
jgi:hypothetical protein